MKGEVERGRRKEGERRRKLLKVQGQDGRADDVEGETKIGRVREEEKGEEQESKRETRGGKKLKVEPTWQAGSQADKQTSKQTSATQDPFERRTRLLLAIRTNRTFLRSEQSWRDSSMRQTRTEEKENKSGASQPKRPFRWCVGFELLFWLLVLRASPRIARCKTFLLESAGCPGCAGSAGNAIRCTTGHEASRRKKMFRQRRRAKDDDPVSFRSVPQSDMNSESRIRCGCAETERETERGKEKERLRSREQGG